MITGIYKKSFLVLLGLAFFARLHSQEVFLKHFTVDDGLPSNEIYQLLQDSAGNLLIATDRGPVQYDGYSFELIPYNSRQHINPVYYIYKTPKGKILFSGLNGLLYQYKNERLQKYFENPQISSLFQHINVLIANTIAEHKDTLWISYNNDNNYDIKTGSCVVLPNGSIKRLSGSEGLFFDIPHQYYYRQLNATNRHSQRVPLFITWKDHSMSIDTVDINWQSGYIRRLFYESYNGLDLFAIGRKIMVYKGGIKWKTHAFSSNILYMTTINHLLYIGLENEGAFAFDLSKGILADPVQSYLKGLSVTCVYKDTNGGMWFATQENGLFYGYPSRPAFFAKKDKIQFIEKNKGRVFIGYFSGLIETFEGGKRTATERLPLRPGDYLYSLSVDKDKAFYPITGKGFFYGPVGKRRFQLSPDVQIIRASDKLAYAAAGPYAGLHIYEGVGGKLMDTALLSKRILSMYYDHQGLLWLGTWEGLLHYAGGKLQRVQNSIKVYNDRIIGIKALADSSTAIASLGRGLALYKEGKTHVLDMTNGLITPIINKMVVEGNTIWLGTNKGLSKVQFSDNRFHVEHFGLTAGLPTTDIHEFTVHGGWMYLKWIDKLVVLSLKGLEHRPVLTTAIKGLFTNEKLFTSQPNAVLPSWKNDLEFHFNCVTVSGAQEQAYEFFLQGFDQQWHVTKERRAKYTNLAPGAYTFYVRSIQYQRVSSEAAAFPFRISAPFTHRWWFIPAVSLLTLALGGIALKQWMQSVKRKNKLRIDLAESNERALVQLINPHFTFNVLNAVQAAILKKDQIQTASIISKFARLMRLTLEMSKEKSVTLQQEMTLLEKYTELELIRAPGRLSFEMHVIPPLNPADVQIPTLLIQPFVENAVKHGILHLRDRKGIVKIFFIKKGSQLLCVIDDNGVGRQQSERINQAIRGEHHSSGIDITVNRLVLLHQQLGTTFYYEVEDKLNPSGHSEGTTIRFSLPYKHLRNEEN